MKLYKYIAIIFPLMNSLSFSVNPVIQICSDCYQQKIIAWGCSVSFPEYADDILINDAINLLVNELGLNRLRIDFLSGNRSNYRAWEWENDNADPNSINFQAFSTDDFSKYLSKFALPFIDEVQKSGKTFNLTLRPSFFNSGSSGRVPIWLFYSPAEYSEFLISKILFLKDSFDINVDYISILNEPGNNNPFNLKTIKDITKYLKNELIRYGLNTKIQFPETYSSYSAWDYLLQSEDDEEFLELIDLISYHGYNPSNTYLKNIFNFADYYNKPIAQTEYFFANTDNLFYDLNIAGVSIWDLYSTYSVLNWNISSVSPNPAFWAFRQFFKFIPPGSIRIFANSNDTLIQPIAFRRNDDYTLIIINKGDSNVISIIGLPPGDYAVNYTQTGIHFTKGIFRVVSDIELKLEPNSITTIYTYKHQNLPPVITNFTSSKNYLSSKDTSLILTVSAVDPELDSISYKWSIVSQPDQSNTKLIHPENPVVEIENIKLPGEYKFQVNVSDGLNIVERILRIYNFDKNNPPIIYDVHNRLPVQITLPVDSTELRASAWDIDSDSVFVNWFLVSAPNGAEPVLLTPTRSRCVVKNLSLPGVYKFKFSAYDRNDTSHSYLTVPVYPLNNPPVIRYLSASDTIITTETATTMLYSDTFDPDNDIITLWWTVADLPYFAKPIIDFPTKNYTLVRNLTVPGEYKFVLRAIDRSKVTADTIRIFVEKSSAISQSYDDVNFKSPLVYPNPFSNSVSISLPKSNKKVINLEIINSNGQIVRKFQNIHTNESNFIINWNGANSDGYQCPSGLYFCIIYDGFSAKATKIIKY